MHAGVWMTYGLFFAYERHHRLNVFVERATRLKLAEKWLSQQNLKAVNLGASN